MAEVDGSVRERKTTLSSKYFGITTCILVYFSCMSNRIVNYLTL